MRGPRPNHLTAFATAAGLTVGALTFGLILLDFRTDLTRTATSGGWFSNFYDLQAEAFLRGNIDVPAGSLGFEGFVVDGRTYTYFGPLPSLLRLPVLAVTHSFDNRLTLLSMALGWLVFAGFFAALLWLVRRCFRRGHPVTVLEAVGAGVLIAAATGGSTLTYDASLPWVYHEAYLWAEASAVVAMFCLLRAMLLPTRSAILWLGLADLIAVLTRATTGWAACVATLLGAGWFLFSRRRRERYGRTWAGFVGVGAMALLVGVAYNMLKFHHPYLFPLQDQVWTQVNAHRREALAVNGGSITGPQFLATSLVNYFTPAGIRFVDYFPWITLPASPAAAYRGAFLDQSYRTGSLTAFMPLLAALTLVGVIAMLRPRMPDAQRSLIPVLAGAILVSAGVMGYGYVANRYVSEFVPGLVVGAAIGWWWLVGFLARAGRGVQIAAVALAALLGTFGIVGNMAVGQQTAAITWRGDRLADYVALQDRVSGGRGTAFAERISRGDGVPSGGRTDDVRIEGDCDALYLNTGDRYEPWILVEQRPQVISVTRAGRARAGQVRLFTIRATRDRFVDLESDARGRLRVVIVDEGVSRQQGPWVDLHRGEPLRIGVVASSDTGLATVTTTPGGLVGRTPFTEWDPDWRARPGHIVWSGTPESDAADLGLDLRRVPGRPLALCEKLMKDIDA